MAIYEGAILNPNNLFRRVNLGPAMAKAKAETGCNPYRQAWQLWRLSRGPGMLDSSDYYLHGLYRDSLDWNQKREFVSLSGSTALNRRVNGPDEHLQTNLIANKLLMAAVLEKAGCPTPPILAIASLPSLPKIYRRLATPNEIVQFLKEVELPVFGKPMDGSRGLGVLSLFERPGDGTTGVMGDGREVRLIDLAREIFDFYASGYIFQPFVRNHPDISEFNPNVGQTLRVVTVQTDRGPEVLYATWRIPGMTALSDNNTTAGRQVTAGIDLVTGMAGRARGYVPFEDFDGVTVHPESGFQIEGRKVPHFDECKALATEMHQLFPAHAILGWDVVPAVDGPVILECNSNPIHFGYQLGNRRGIMNPAIMVKLRPHLARHPEGWIGKLRAMGEAYRRDR